MSQTVSPKRYIKVLTPTLGASDVTSQTGSLQRYPSKIEVGPNRMTGPYERGNLEAETEVQEERHVKTENYNEASTRPGTTQTASKLPEARKQPGGVQREHSPTDTCDFRPQPPEPRLNFCGSGPFITAGDTCQALHTHYPITSGISLRNRQYGLCQGR